jgi:hypothetical protein
VVRPGNERYEGDRGAVLEAIKYHFTRNTILWKNVTARPWHHSDEDAASAVRRVSRVDVEDSYEEGPASPPYFNFRLNKYFDRFGTKTNQSEVLKLFKKLQALHIEGPPPRGLAFKIEYGSVDKFIESIREITHYSQGPLDEKFHMCSLENLTRRTCIMHGDLNGRNLTWSDNYEKFFLIDFEHVGFGFWGADQLKLICSIASELVADEIRTFDAADKTRRERLGLLHANTMNCIRYIDRLTDQLRGDPQPEEKPPTGIENFVESFVHEVVKSAEMTRDLGNESGFWRYALICFSYKQLEYALSHMTPQALKTIRTLNTQLKSARSLDPNFLNGSVDWPAMGMVAQLVYSYATFIATIPSRYD